MWIVTNIKTRDTYSHDALIVPQPFVAFVDAYVTHIRPSFVTQFSFRKRTPQQTDVQNQHRNGLFVGPNGRRYERFAALPKVTKALLGVKINVTDWRKIIATAADDHLSAEDVKVLSVSDTHSELTVKRYYAKRNARTNVTKAVALTQRLYQIMNGKATPHNASAAAASQASALLSSLSSSSSSSLSMASASSSSVSSNASQSTASLSTASLSSGSRMTLSASGSSASSDVSVSPLVLGPSTVSAQSFLNLFNRRSR